MNQISSTRRRRGLFVALLGAALVAALAGPAGSSSGVVVTSGAFHAFAAGEGMDISGQAQMVRTADGRTIVAIEVRGLNPETTYGSHVHAAACGVGNADGHYKFDPAGPPAPPNEIWPGPFTTNPAGIGNGFTIADGTAGPTAVSVVVHAPGGAKIACADLG
ncbi:MAG TPA: hypothetical protein VGL18_05750 [Actinomycetota bacterium]